MEDGNSDALSSLCPIRATSASLFSFSLPRQEVKNVSKLIAQMPDVTLYAHEKGKNKVTLFHFTGRGSDKQLPKGKVVFKCHAVWLLETGFWFGNRDTHVLFFVPPTGSLISKETVARNSPQSAAVAGARSKPSNRRSRMMLALSPTFSACRMRDGAQTEEDRPRARDVGRAEGGDRL